MTHALRGRWPLATLALALLAACGGGSDDPTPPAPPPEPQARFQADIRRTATGVPHIKASDWAGLGYGYGYAQAEDNLCTLADAFLTYRGERSRYFGAQATLKTGGTIERPANLDSDFFHRHVITDARVDAMAAAQSADLRELVRGFVAGYNRYMREAPAGNAHAECRGQPWVGTITETDIYRRLYQANLAGGYANFVEAIANATPPDGTSAAGNAADKTRALAVSAPAMQVGGEVEGVGSNMYGFGTAGTGTDTAVLFGNPHWYWRGPDRFYQAQLTIPGTVDVGGVSMLGMPVLLIGYNANVAWSHTVSTARRFGFFELSLVPGAPTQYLRDGKAVAMQAHPITVQVKQDDGSVTAVTRTLYRTDDGPLVDLTDIDESLDWNANTAFVVRDINADNYRVYDNWLRWNRASSLDELIAIQRQEAAVPWVNTVAVGRDRKQAWYADIGAVPNVSTAQIETCTTAVGEAIGEVLPGVPFFDGSRSACDWQTDPDSAQPGAMGASRMPSLLRDDYVANMNDSYWLANPKAPLTGYSPVMGDDGSQAVSLRTRLGHAMAQARIDGADGEPGRGATHDSIQRIVLNNRVYSAELFKDDALALACPGPFNADLALACGTLRAWDNTGEASARGAHLWDAFWTRASEIDEDDLYAVPFDEADPIHTPRRLKRSAMRPLKAALMAAIDDVKASGYPLDAPRSEYLYATRNGERIGLYGGCGTVGYFTIACPEPALNEPGYAGMDKDPNGNTYMQVVSYPGGKLRASTLLAPGLSDDPASPYHGEGTRAYAKKQWVEMPFTDAEIAASPGYRSMSIQEDRARVEEATGGRPVALDSSGQGQAKPRAYSFPTASAISGARRLATITSGISWN